MKLTQYTRQEAAIAAAETNGIRQRWLYGLRLLADDAMMSPGGGGLRHGASASLIQAARTRGLKLSATEIRRRLQCARRYPTEAQISQVLADFKTWFDLLSHVMSCPCHDPDVFGHTCPQAGGWVAPWRDGGAGWGPVLREWYGDRGTADAAALTVAR